MTTRDASLRERFESKVDRGGECHVWTAAGVTQRGAAQLRVPGVGLMLATHVAWFLETGVWPAPLWVLHHCDNPPCVRFDHLFLGTQVENMADMARKGRSAHVRLTPEQVRAIRVADGSQRQIAKAFGVTQSTVWRILHGQQRRHIA
jgi:hypothetical protein